MKSTSTLNTFQSVPGEDEINSTVQRVAATNASVQGVAKQISNIVNESRKKQIEHNMFSIKVQTTIIFLILIFFYLLVEINNKRM